MTQLTILDTCWGKYAIHYYAKDLQKALSELAEVSLITKNLELYKNIPTNNLEGSAIIVERIDGKFVIFDWNDLYGQNSGIVQLRAHKDCVGYFNSQPCEELGNLETQIPHLEIKYRVFDSMYTNHYSRSFDELQDSIYFSGDITGIRIANNEFLRTEKYKNHPEFLVLPKIEFDKYLKDIFMHKLIYSPAGGGDFAHRDFETFALGIPVIRQKYKSTTTTLRAGVHYIDVDSVKDFKELLGNKELLCNIGANGRLWYEENCLYPGNVREMKQIVKDLLI